MTQQEQATVECLTFLRAASVSMSSAAQVRGYADLSDEMRDEMLAMKKQLDSLVTRVWNTLGTDE